ncbi:MAG TPA: lysophospholipid acyltransferase family protein [Candidatus Deferrimicrobium sp.]|nr:lysophospholipid acyltransferase family protein [Candidatus Deferrimicrobium sp.]
MTIVKKLKRNIVYYLACLLVWLFSAMPRRLAVFAGACLGLAAWRFLSKDQHKVHRHLSLTFPDRLNSRQQQNIGRELFINSGKNLSDVVRLRRHYEKSIRPLITFEGLEHFDSVMKREKGVIGITGHIGNFELLGAAVAQLGYRIAVIGRQLYDPRLDEILVENRRTMGLTVFSTTESPRRILQWLRSGGALGVLIDTDSIRVRGIFLPFFGRLANTPVGQTLLGLRTGSAFVPMACVRTDDNRYRVIIRPEVRVALSGDTAQDARKVTLECVRALEQIIEAYPTQWIWFHNRWHTRPED